MLYFSVLLFTDITHTVSSFVAVQEEHTGLHIQLYCTTVQKFLANIHYSLTKSPRL